MMKRKKRRWEEVEGEEEKRERETKVYKDCEQAKKALFARATRQHCE